MSSGSSSGCHLLDLKDCNDLVVQIYLSSPHLGGWLREIQAILSIEK